MKFSLFTGMLAAVAVTSALAAPPAPPDGGKPPSPSDKSADKRTGARPSDPLANLKPYEERRYRMELDECAKEKGTERRVCERSVKRHAEAKSRRRSAAGY